MDFNHEEMDTSNEHLNKTFSLNVEKFSNAAEILELVEGSALNNILNNKHVDVQLKVEIVPSRKTGSKKKLPTLYSNNTYILFTQLFSRLKLTWKASNKMWELMGVDENNQPLDENGHDLRYILGQIESFHKQIYITENVSYKNENGSILEKEVTNVEKTNRVRKNAVEYAINLLVACYNNAPVIAPDSNDKEATIIYKYLDDFKSTMDKFKVFIKSQKFEDNNTRVEKKTKVSKTKIAKPPKSKVKKLTAEMVSDLIRDNNEEINAT
ncbi:pp31/39K [Hyphantria cunea granulovirus]|uniref:Pp31/39K n=1 Tax=Hyphantria cunea granulovirus TaxID=307448 RepID=A0AAF1D272_9BBAC|nr:pp31/39K [Hyphantria cunea granulovirus]QBQ01600.1 pp31/39K [Hyphantria cunea granulovirus]